jgi:hypothetical protein
MLGVRLPRPQETEKGRRTDPVGGRLRLQLGQFCGIHGAAVALSVGHKKQGLLAVLYKYM